jgi:TonB family protein
MPDWLRRSFIAAIIISILLHIAAAIFIFFFRVPMPIDLEPQPIEVFDAKGMQIADQLLKGNRQVPKKAEHIGIDDNAVTEETVARPQSTRPKQRASMPAQPAQEAVKQTQPARQPRQASPKLQFNRSSLYAVDPSLFAMNQPRERSTKQGPDQQKTTRRSSIPRTAVSSTMNVESEAYLPEDYYPNYSYGAHTYLNVLRYPDIEYFVRLKRAFKQTWSPMSSVQQYVSSGGRSNTIAVVLAVGVDPSGNMSEIFVLRSSGYAAYDQEALRTVRANSPFTAPPEKLLKDGQLRMSWTFIVYM